MFPNLYLALKNRAGFQIKTFLLARDVIYTIRAYAMMSVSVCDGSALAHYSSFRFQIPNQIYRTHPHSVHAGAHCDSPCIRAHCGRGACREGHLALC